MSTHTCARNTPAAKSTELTVFRRVVAQHIRDGLRSGNPVAAALARSLMTELDVAGLDVADAVNALRGCAGCGGPDCVGHPATAGEVTAP